MKNTKTPRSATCKAPFPYFGGKSKVADLIWDSVGKCNVWFEPFCGSAAVTLAAPPGSFHHAVVNDLDPLIANVWRALKYKPDEVAAAADMPMDHITTHSIRHALVGERERIVAKLLADPEWCDPVWAGRVCYQLSTYIGSKGMTPLDKPVSASNGVSHAVPCFATPRVLTGMQPLPTHNRPFDGNRYRDWFGELANRMSRCAILCCDWKRLAHQMDKPDTAIFFDPPYPEKKRSKVYTMDSWDVAGEVRDWCGNHKGVKWIYAGYDTDCIPLANETCGTLVRWNAQGGFSNQAHKQGRINAKRECLVFSPAFVNNPNR